MTRWTTIGVATALCTMLTAGARAAPPRDPLALTLHSSDPARADHLDGRWALLVGVFALGEGPASALEVNYGARVAAEAGRRWPHLDLRGRLDLEVVADAGGDVELATAAEGALYHVLGTPSLGLHTALDLYGAQVARPTWDDLLAGRGDAYRTAGGGIELATAIGETMGANVVLPLSYRFDASWGGDGALLLQRQEVSAAVSLRSLRERGPRYDQMSWARVTNTRWRAAGLDAASWSLTTGIERVGVLDDAIVVHMVYGWGRLQPPNGSERDVFVGRIGGAWQGRALDWRFGYESLYTLLPSEDDFRELHLIGTGYGIRLGPIEHRVDYAIAVADEPLHLVESGVGCRFGVFTLSASYRHVFGAGAMTAHDARLAGFSTRLDATF